MEFIRHPLPFQSSSSYGPVLQRVAAVVNNEYATKLSKALSLAIFFDKPITSCGEMHISHDITEMCT